MNKKILSIDELKKVCQEQIRQKNIVTTKKGAKWKYIKLPDLLKELTDICSKHGYRFEQTIQYVNGDMLLVSDIRQGENPDTVKRIMVPFPSWEQLNAHQKLMSTVQHWGATLTYLRRYSLFILFDMFPEEDNDDLTLDRAEGPQKPFSKPLPTNNSRPPWEEAPKAPDKSLLNKTEEELYWILKGTPKKKGLLPNLSPYEKLKEDNAEKIKINKNYLKYRLLKSIQKIMAGGEL